MGANMVFRSPDRGVTWKRSAAISPQRRSRHAADDGRAACRPTRCRATTARRRSRPDDDRRIAARPEAALHRQRRWARARDARRRPDVDRLSRREFRAARRHVCQQRAAVAPRGRRVYATFDGHYNDDYRPYVFVSDDYGQTWRRSSRACRRRGPSHARTSENPRCSFSATSAAFTSRSTAARPGRR